MDRPLIAVEDPPDFPGQNRTHRYRVIDANRNRTVGFIRGEQLGLPREQWVWGITVPPAARDRTLTPGGTEPTRHEALAALKAAWLTYEDDPNWPPLQSAAWLAPGPREGMGPWRPGDEPRGWQRYAIDARRPR